MKRLLNYSFIISLYLAAQFATAQNRTAFPGEKMLSKAALIEDYTLLYISLITYHPVPYLFTSETQLKLYYQEQMALFPDSLSELDFLLFARRLVTKIKCGHTFITATEELNKLVFENKPLLPFSINIQGDRILINNTIDSIFEFQIGDEILQVNGIPIQQMLDKMEETQSRDGETFSFVDYVSSTRFQGFFQFQYGDQDSVLVKYRDQFGVVNETVVRTSNAKMKAKPANTLPESFKTVYQNDWSLFAVDSIQKLGYLKIKSFRDRKTFKDYYKMVFQHLDSKGYSKLIVDIRDNGGGYFLNGNHFLTYLTQEKFDFNFRRLDKKIKNNKHVHLDFWSKLTRFVFTAKPKKIKDDGWKTTTFTFKPAKHNFKGNVHLLTNGSTFSQASLAAAQLKEKGATVYGSETGGTENSTNCLINYRLILPNSKLKTTIPHFQAISNSTKGEFGQGIKPNFELFPEIGSSTDNVLLEVINLITDSSVEKP